MSWRQCHVSWIRRLLAVIEDISVHPKSQTCSASHIGDLNYNVKCDKFVRHCKLMRQPLTSFAYRCYPGTKFQANTSRPEASDAKSVVWFLKKLYFSGKMICSWLLKCSPAVASSDLVITSRGAMEGLDLGAVALYIYCNIAKFLKSSFSSLFVYFMDMHFVCLNTNIAWLRSVLYIYQTFFIKYLDLDNYSDHDTALRVYFRVSFSRVSASTRGNRLTTLVESISFPGIDTR